MAIGLSTGVVNAADISEVCQPLAATIDAGYMAGNDAHHHFNDNIPPGPNFDVRENADFHSFFGEAAALYKFCNTDLNAQIDGAYFDHRFKFGTDDAWHAGGVLFLRDQNIGVVGIDASYIGKDRHYDFASPDTVSKWLRFGVRGEWFAGENFTLGAHVGHIDGDTNGYNLNGFDETVWARIYATPNLALTARLDAGQFDYTGETLSEWAVSGDAEFLVPDSQMSVFAGAHYAMKHDTYLGNAFIPNTQDETYVEGFAGLKIYFGTAEKGNTLVSQHRNNTLDNTSMFFERVPGSDSFMNTGP